MNVLRPIAIFLAGMSLAGAEQGGFLLGTVRDQTGGAIPGAELRIQSEQTGARQKIACDNAGSYASSELAAGTYKVTVRRDGFRTITRADIEVAPGKSTRVDFTIELLPLEQEVTVSAAQSEDDPMVSGVTMSRNTPSESLPANGRDVHALFSLIPGATITPASLTSGGQFTVGGQRPNQNSFRVDGINGNVGIGVVSVPGAFLGGSLPNMTVLGGTQSLASKEETERVELRSTDFAAEHGDRPGAQIDIQTRAGSNEFHGSVFGYIRPHALDSQDWFARGAQPTLPSASLNGWGGSAGGPLSRRHTYFFASFERTDVHDSALQLIPVASSAARLKAGSAYQPVLDAFPQPSGPPLNANESVGFSPLQKNAGVTNSSVRIDQTIGSHVQLFARYTHVPSVATTIELGAAYSAFDWKSATFGANVAAGLYTHQFRLNYSTSSANAAHGPADTPDLNLISGTLADVNFGYWMVSQLSVGGMGQTIAGQALQNSQNQTEGNYVAERHSAKQDFRIGGDLTLLYAGNPPATTALTITAPGLGALLSGVPLGLTNTGVYGPEFRTKHWSAFTQDTIRINGRQTLLLGVRWEYTPPPSQLPSSYYYIGYWRGIGSLPTRVSYDPINTAFHWPRRYSQFAPRVGWSYHLPAPGVVLRAGAGVFYDTQIGSITSNQSQLSMWQYLPTSATPALYGGSTSPPAAAPLFLPRVLEWRTSVEKSLGEESTLSVSYSGSAARRLLRNEAAVDPTSSILRSLTFTSHGKADYEALLVQYRANFARHLFVLASYTWSHSLDTGSSDTEPFLVAGGVSDARNRGPSDFDVRHVLTASFGYHLGKWNLSSTLFARSGFPFDVTTVDRGAGFGFVNSDRANLVAGEPIWLSDSNVPGGRQLNPAAFQVPADGQNGTLGRNALTGADLFQFDVNVRRRLAVFRRVSAELNLSAFNLFNHPSFSNPVNYLGSALFGQATSTTNLMLGSGSPTTGLTPLYQEGGPRTLELGLRFTF